MSTRNRCVVLSSVVLLLLLSLSAAYATGTGLQNPGFETGSLSPWQDPPVGDSVTVVGTQGAEIQTYADLGITVSPYIGHYMVRLGTPKEVSEKQPRGDNIVSQTFTPDKDKLNFSTRIFSWEHRGDDSVVISLKDSNGNDISGITVTGKDGNALSLNLGIHKGATCTSLPCDFVMDVGKSGDFIDSGWVVFELHGLPTDGSQVTLEYDVIGGQNESHATWAYFDNTNTPPVAKFSFTPNNPQEGQQIIFNGDASYDPDPGDKVVKWEWTFTDPVYGQKSFVSTKGDNFSYLFPNDGSYSISLTVTDTYGATNTVSTGGTTTDQVSIPELVVHNVAPFARSLNYEVLAGTQMEFVSRFADVGFFDHHTASWSIPGVSNINVQEQNVPFLATGIATGTFTAPDTAQTFDGKVQIDDGDGGVTSVNVKVKVLGSACDAAHAREPNDTISEAIPLASDGAYLSCIDNPNDIDIFEITLPDGSPIPPGSEVLIRLKDLPADYDLIALKKIATDPALASTVDEKWSRTNPSFSWYATNPSFSWYATNPSFSWYATNPSFSWYATNPSFSWYATNPSFSWYATNPSFSWYATNPSFSWYATPITMNQFPLSNLAFTPPDGTDLSSTDINLSELGFDVSPGSGLALAGYSANRGFDDESILIRTDYGDSKLYVAVVGNNGAFNPTPYSLQIETSQPLDVAGLAADKCSGTPLVSGSNQTSGVETLISRTSPHTLFVTQKGRMKATYGMDDTAWSGFQGKIATLAQQPGVQGMMVSLASTDYDAWDSSPCSVVEANKVTDKVRDEIFSILQAHPSIEYVVLVGNDDIVPYRRVVDSTSTTNEQLYTNDSFTKIGSPLYASLITGNNLTDDFYVDNAPVVGQGGIIFEPKLSVGRMVETPPEIEQVADAYISNNGVINLTSAFVTGYDFFNDSAEATASTFTNAGLITDLLTDTANSVGSWTANDLRCELFGSYAASGCVTHDVNNFNAHFTHYLGQSAYGFDHQTDDFMTSSDVANAGGGTPVLSSELAYTNGCHAGLNVPDGTASPNAFGGANANLDFPQSMARQRAVYIGNTGFGVGTPDGIAGTERLMTLFSQELLSQPTVGKALTVAKQRFLNELGVVSAYEEKASIEATLYGLPMYQLAGSSITALQSAQSITQDYGTPYGTLNLDVTETDVDSGLVIQTTNDTGNIGEVTNTSGSYFTIDGVHEAITSRAIQPKYIKNLATGKQVHGIVVTGGQFTDMAGFDPVITQMIQEWSGNTQESSACLNAFWPGQLATSSVVNNGDQQLILVPGQFRCDSGGNATVTGTERLFTDLSVNVFRSDNGDTQPPLVTETDVHRSANGDATITVHATDPSGIARVVILVLDPITGMMSSVSSTGPSVSVPGLGDKKAIVQVVDGAGNVTTLSGKGAYMKGIEVDAGPDRLFSTSTETSLTATVVNFTSYLAKGLDFSYVWNFGDGTLKPGTLADNGVPKPGVVIDNNGNATFTVQHQYTSTSDLTASVKVTDGNGGIGIDYVNMVSCSDKPDLGIYGYLDYTGCDVDNSTPTAVTLYVTTRDPISDTVQYRVHLDIQTKPNDPTPDGKDDVMLKYQGGSFTGMKTLNVTQVGPNTLRFDFDLAEEKWKGTYFDWWAETQDGVAGAPQAGFIDVMPDSGMFRYYMH